VTEKGFFSFAARESREQGTAEHRESEPQQSPVREALID